MENELRLKRKQLGLTQAQMAKACGVSRRTYQTYEETELKNDTYNDLLAQLNEICDVEGKRYILSVKVIKALCGQIFSRYPEVKCAYLYGSYARGEATGESDVDILVVCPPMGLSFYKMASELEKVLFKQVDLQTHRQIGDNDSFLERILTEGIKIYDKKNNSK